MRENESIPLKEGVGMATSNIATMFCLIWPASIFTIPYISRAPDVQIDSADGPNCFILKGRLNECIADAYTALEW